MTTGIERHELGFVAPIPQGHEVLVVTLRRSADATATSSFAFDQTAGIVYCDEDLLYPLGLDVLATRDPMAVLGRWSWTVERATTGRAAGAIVSTKNEGESNHASTRLWVQVTEPGAPYRG